MLVAVSLAVGLYPKILLDAIEPQSGRCLQEGANETTLTSFA